MNAREASFVKTPQGRKIAYVRTMAELGNLEPPVVFLGGFRSDMNGTKATFLEHWAQRSGRGFLRFDYSGHGLSSGVFEEGAIGEWVEDALFVVNNLTEGPQILVGSSMGGWVSMLLMRQIPHQKIAGFVGISSAPDFTEDLMWETFSKEQREALTRYGFVELPSGSGEEPYRITRKLIEDGRHNLVLRRSFKVPFPVHLLHGTEDKDVPFSVALRTVEVMESPNLRLTLLRGMNHRFSSEGCLRTIRDTILSLETRQ